MFTIVVSDKEKYFCDKSELVKFQEYQFENIYSSTLKNRSALYCKERSHLKAYKIELTENVRPNDHGYVVCIVFQKDGH